MRSDSLGELIQEYDINAYNNSNCKRKGDAYLNVDPQLNSETSSKLECDIKVMVNVTFTVILTFTLKEARTGLC